MSTELLPLIADEPAGPTAPGRPTCGELSSSMGERLPLKALSVEAAIVGLTSTATVRQRFVNTGDTAIEATYVFPLPARAGVTDFEARLAGRRVIGELKERGQAREDYEQALVAGQRAAIVEEDRSDVFSVRVGNLGPGEEAIVEMRLTGPLAFEDGEATFRFPLVVAPRYTTGRPLSGDQTGAGVGWDTDAVPDASRVTPPRLAADDERPELEVSLTLQGGGLAVSGVRASLPTAVLEGSIEGATRAPTLLRLEPGARADRDFVLRFAVDRSELSSCALLVPDASDGPDVLADAAEGTWSVTLLPPAETSSAPRDVVVLLDRSGSMDGWKMVAARRAAGRIVDMLEPADRFCVLAFDDRIDTPSTMPAGLVEASDRNRFAAASWLGSLESRGGTEMADPLHRAVQMLAGSGQERMASVVLVTDGQISGEDHLLRTLAPLIGRTRSYCVGIDQAVNAGFLDRLAGLGNGRAELVESEERLDEAMARLARTIGRPSLTAIEVSGDGIELVVGTRTPGRSPDAFAGVPCVISGRYRGRLADAAAFRVDAVGAAGPFTTEVPAQVAPDALAVRTIWARSVVRDLEDAYASGLGDSELSSRLVAHSIRFGVLSRFTAFVAIDPERTEAGALNEVVQPVETPSGWGAASYSMAAPAGMMAAPVAAVPMMPVGEVMPSYGAPTARAAMAPRAKMPAPVPVPVPAPPRPPRPLKKLLKEAEKATQVRRTGVDGVVAELTQHRMSTGDPALRAALDRLCDALSRFLRTPGPALAREVLVAVETVKRAAAGADHAQPTARRRFWQ